MDKFLGKMRDLLDTDTEINMDTKLSNLEEWDSLSIVSFLAMANASYGKKIKKENLKSAKTISDLYNLVK